MPDRIQMLPEAAQARHTVTLARDEETLRILARRGQPITFRGFAQEAGVSRSWLYRQPQLREEIDRLRLHRSSPSQPVPLTERASADSLRQQIRASREEIARLRAENQALNEQLARRLGATRAASVTEPF